MFDFNTTLGYCRRRMKYTDFALLDQEKDPLFEDAARLVIEHQNASASFLQRKMSLGYARAAHILDELQMARIIGPMDGAKPRDILVESLEDFQQNGPPLAKSDYFVQPITINYRVPDFKLTVPNDVGWGKPLAATKYEPLEIPFGHDGDGNLDTVRLDDLNHLLVVGNPLSKKMEFLDSLLLSQLIKVTPSQLNLVLLDESNYLNLYKQLPHLLMPVVNDHFKGLSVIKWTVEEIKRRQKMFTEAGVRNLSSYRELSGSHALPEILLVLRMFDVSEEYEYGLNLISSYGQHTGIHLVMVVDQASGKYISSRLKSNIPNRLVFKTTSVSDSSTAGVKGAEKLGVGEAILRLDSSGEKKITTIYTSEKDISDVIHKIQDQQA